MPAKKKAAKKAVKAAKKAVNAARKTVKAAKTGKAKKAAKKVSPFAPLNSRVKAFEIRGLGAAGGMCRMALTKTHRLDRPARNKADCDDMAALAGAIDHLFVKNR